MLDDVLGLLRGKERALRDVPSSLLTHLIVVLSLSKDNLHDPSYVLSLELRPNEDLRVGVSQLSHKSLCLL
jgi:hypothetical protein